MDGKWFLMYNAVNASVLQNIYKKNILTLQNRMMFFLKLQDINMLSYKQI